MSPVPTRYEDDLYTWAEEQVALLRAGRLSEVDALNVAEELSDVGKSELKGLRSSIAVLSQHLLKWDHQPKLRSLSWMATVNEQRRQIRLALEDSPGLRSKLETIISDGYASGRDKAVAESGLDYDTFPEVCPYSFEDMMARPIVYEQPGRRKKR
jgi:hypothetical protein